MRELIAWLIENEDKAAKVYRQAADVFSGSEYLSAFLANLSKEELEHGEIIRRAAKLTEKMTDFPAIVKLDVDTKREVADYFSLCEKRLATKRLTKENIMDFIVATEFSEWNDLFVYVINTLKHRYREFVPVAACIQAHKRNIEYFIETNHEFNHHQEEIRKLPRIWDEKLLVVEDDTDISDIIVSFIEGEGAIDVAANGEEALAKLAGKYYAAIISDVDMPVMNGVEFYKKAVEAYPHIKERFLFFTGTGDESLLSFFMENNLRYLPKPAGIKNIKKEVISIIHDRYRA